MPKYQLTSGLPTYPAGLEDDKASLVLPLYRAINGVAQQLSVMTGNVQYDPTEQASIDQFTKLGTQRTQVIFVQAAEDLLYGNLLTLSLSSGKIVAHKATQADTSKPAHALLNVTTGLTTGQYGEALFMFGKSAGVTGTGFMTPYYLATNGQMTATPPSTAGYLRQHVGYGLGSSGVYLAIEPAIVL